MNHELPELHTLSDIFPCFRAISAEEWASAKPELRTFPAAMRIFRGEDSASYAFFVVKGTVQISSVSQDGRESLSNRLSAGDICAMMVLSGLSEREYPGVVTAETEVTILLVAKNFFLHWIQCYAPIRNAVFGNILDGMIRMGSLLTVKMSQPLDSRLAEVLVMLSSEHQPTVHITHQQLAVKLGSAREVVSRVLSRMEKKGWVATGRGWVTVRQRTILTALIDDQVTEDDSIS